MKKWISLITVLFIILSVNIGAVLAQSYYFQVPKAVVAYYLTEDGTAGIEYTYQFVNNSGSPDIEFVDIGMPANSKYSYSNMSAEINGNKITHIQKSEYVSNAVEFGLGDYAIPANGTGTFHAMIWGVENVVFVGTAEEEEAYAGSEFQPNYFESGTVSGSTDMTVTIVLPAGIAENEPRYYTPQGWPGADEPLSRRDDQDRVTYTWQDSNASMTSRYVFGASFPARYVPEDKILEEPVDTSSGSGFGGIISDIFQNFTCCGIGSIFAVFFGWSIYQSTAGAKKRKMKYLPPKISIEGHGIKRGLTAVEAAILLEEPMDKVLTMVLFSVVKKGAANVTSKDPLKLDFLEPIPEGLRAYEVDFLRAFKEEKPGARRNELQSLMVKLVKSITKKIKGFSYKETVEYYKNITEKAWKHVEEANTPEVSMKNLDEAMEWTMLDKDYEDRSKRVFTGPVYVPMWWGRYDPSFGGSSMGGGAAGKGFSSGKSSGGQSVSLPHLPGSDFAASVVTGIQGFSAGVIGDLTKFTGGITDKTNPIPKSTYSGGRSGGGSSCACACASCACACAGGGR